jgi:D-arabinose 1-dehydrogenase-like Zn-dependent alcohol dehydrogenase
MKAAVLYKVNTPLEVVDVKQEDPKPGEARVKVKAAGICHSDWHIINGDWTLPLSMVLGHEAAGIVEAQSVGSRPDGPKVIDPVAEVEDCWTRDAPNAEAQALVDRGADRRPSCRLLPLHGSVERDSQGG